MSYFKVRIVYPNNQEELIEEDFFTLNKAKEYADHILGQVQYNAKFHERKIDSDGDTIAVEPYCVILEYDNNNVNVVFDTRKK